ncbi:FG-GAP repeat family protein [Verticillium alfalfae VaMs.102]|uniref:FG-GAP repeat family protein n=1 Tax=Verticillium alfalfae (strain VaMs.102 / ATCC MYA-4576 / FGSC 10136) TaxID=526221 RepID=C9SZ35_VERA1|nr:FG-GAP repeat family protein [Verticillium alfalfae VaMs.102]EEY24050.1 FG-GAP repeat family protein [Verticillium alfalfae VaMs.102]
MERLGRGIVAVRSSNTDVLISWRLLGLDPDDIAFNLYRTAIDNNRVKLNTAALRDGTNFVDRSADLTQENTYTVRPVVDGQEGAVGGTFTLSADNAVEPVVRIPISKGGPIKFVWVGDLDGDGEYDYVLDRQTSPQLLEAYASNGTFLWQVNMGPNSESQDNISPGSSANNLGHWDGVTVYDFDSDGRAEVAVRIANGVTFGDGQRFTHANDDEQFIAILDGRTRALRARAQIPTDYISDGPLAARFGVGYLDGRQPSLIQWKWRREGQDAPDGHNTRIIDVDGDGQDEVHEIGFTLNGDGQLRYSLGPQGIVHGDRFHIAKMDPQRTGLQGYGIQQNNPNGLLEYYYDATQGKIIWKHSLPEGIADVGRGLVGDIDPTSPGMEVWSFSGVYNGPSNQLLEQNTTLAPWPHLGLYWDGDILMELYNDGKIEKWDWESPSTSNSVPRLVTTRNFGAGSNTGRNPAFHGDILGDWREEVILVSPENDELIIFTADRPSDIRLYTLAHNPAYRNSMTLKGCLLAILST